MGQRGAGRQAGGRDLIAWPLAVDQGHEAAGEDDFAALAAVMFFGDQNQFLALRMAQGNDHAPAHGQLVVEDFG